MQPWFKETVRRWFTIVGYAVVAACVVLTVFAILGNAFDIERWLKAGYHWAAGTTLLAILIGLVARPSKRPFMRLFASLGWHYPLRYPPAYVGALVAMDFLWFASWRFDSWWGITQPLAPINELVQLPWHWTGRIVPWTCLWLVPVMPTFFLALTKRSGRNQVIRALETHKRAPATLNNSVIERWIKNDSEVDDPSLDFFGHGEVADRIAKRLASPREGEAPNILISGPVGSGKSTIRALVVDRLKTLRADVLVVSVSLWPYQSQEAAVAGIIDAIVDALGERVSTLSLRGVATEYRTLISAAGDHFDQLSNALRPSDDPQDTIEQINRVAAAIGITLAVWIEDLERFSATAQPGGSRSAPRAQDAIFALIHILDRQSCVCVVIADATLDQRADVEKLVRYIERPPSLDPVRAMEVFHLLRESVLSDPSIITPQAVRSRTEFRLRQSWIDQLTLRKAVLYSPTHFDAACVSLVQTPRQLKAAARYVYDCLDVLGGEIDPDDVIAVSILRICEPTIFAFIDQSIERFRGNIVPDKDRPDTVKDAIGPALPRKAPVRHDAVQLVVRHLFPAFGSPITDALEINACQIKPQGIARRSSRNYWNRLTALPQIAESEQDQRDLTLFHNGSSDQLVKYLLDPGEHDLKIRWGLEVESTQLPVLLQQLAINARDLICHRDTLICTSPGLSLCKEWLSKRGWLRPDLQWLPNVLGAAGQMELAVVNILCQEFVTEAVAKPTTDADLGLAILPAVHAVLSPDATGIDRYWEDVATRGGPLVAGNFFQMVTKRLSPTNLPEVPSLLDRLATRMLQVPSTRTGFPLHAVALLGLRLRWGRGPFEPGDTLVGVDSQLLRQALQNAVDDDTRRRLGNDLMERLIRWRG